MLDYYDYSSVASDILADLGISDDMYKDFDNSSVQEFVKSHSLDKITDIVNDEVAKLDTSDMIPSDIEDFKANVVDEIYSTIDTIVQHYYDMKNSITYDVYNSITDLLKYTPIDNVTRVDVDYDAADPSVGIYGDERYITFTLSNGATITFNVEIDEL